VQPKVAVLVGSVLRAPRLIRHGGNFTHLFSPVRADQLDYVDGLMVVTAIFLIFVVMWAFLLIVLKFKGREVGCASGRPFVTLSPDEPYDGDGCGESEYDDDGNDSTTSSSGTYSSRQLFLDRNDDVGIASKKRGTMDGRMETAKYPPGDDDRTFGRSSYNSDDALSVTAEVTKHSEEDEEEDAIVDGDDRNDASCLQTVIRSRENRTRICFLLFASTALICAPLILVLSFGPIKEATQTSDAIILVGRREGDRKMEFLCFLVGN
jgi:hypothetical protein